MNVFGRVPVCDFVLFVGVGTVEHLRGAGHKFRPILRHTFGSPIQPVMVGVCRTLLNTGSCNNDICRSHHDVHICETCSVVCITGKSYQAHLAGKPHGKALKRAAHAQAHGIDTEFCELCQVSIFNNNWERHQRTKRHTNKQRFFAFKSLLEEAEKDKHGISVSIPEGVDFGIIEVEEAEAGRNLQLTITSSVPYSNVRLADVKLTSTSNRGRNSP